MSNTLLTRAELIKLSRVLACDETSVAFLAPIGQLGLRTLQECISVALFDEYRGALQRLADAARLLPASLVAKMSEKVFGPMLSARVAGLMSPDKAVDVASKLDTNFLAEVTVQLDPRSAARLLDEIPLKITTEVARLLLERREYVTMGRFVDALSEDSIRAVMKQLSDEALVRIGFFVERGERVVELIEMVSADRLRGIVKAVATGSGEMQAAGLALMGQLSPRQQGKLGDLAVGLGAPVLTALIGTAQRENASAVISSVMVNVSGEGRRSFASLLESMDPNTLALWAQATTRAGLWPAALKILADSGAEIQGKAATALKRLPAVDRATVAAQVKLTGLGPALAALAESLK